MVLEYSKPCTQKTSSQIPLPDPTGPLSKKIDSVAIEEANAEVTAVIMNTSAGSKCMQYLKLEKRTEDY